MSSPDGASASHPSFDDLLDRLLRGATIDAEVLSATLPFLTEDEQRQLRKLCPALPAPASAVDAGFEAPPVSRLGPYRLGQRIGVGASGAVFAAVDEVLDRPAAIKVVGPDVVGSGERGERFEREARALAKLRHPNVVSVFGAGGSSGLRYIAMELITGSSLADLLAAKAESGAVVEVRDVVRWGLEIARALAAAHEVGVLHRDVKPSNIRIADDGRAVLLDFGLAAQSGAATLTETGGYRGSPQYSSPEQVEGHALDARTDVYSLGATLYEALAGVAPFRASTRAQLFHQILTQDPVALRKVDATIPRDLATVVHAALEKEPGRRHASAAQFAKDLEAVLEGRPVSVRPPSPWGRLTRWARRHPARAALVGLAGIVVPTVLVVGGFLVANLDTIKRGAAATRAEDLARILEDGYLEYGEGDLARALVLFEEALRIDPGSEEAQAGRVLTLLWQGETGRALALLPANASRVWVEGLREDALVRGPGAPATRAAPIAPSSAVDHFVAGMMDLNRFHNGQRAAAAAALEHLQRAVLESRAPNPLYLSELGHAAWHAGAHAEARRVAAAIGDLFPETPERWFAVGRALIDAEPSKAWDAFEKAASPPPRSIHARGMIVLRLAESRRRQALKTALALGQETLALDPGRAQLHFALGVAHMMAGESDLAITRLSEALRLKPTQSGAHNRLAELFAGAGRIPEAIVAGREAVRRDPQNSAAWNTLGVSLLMAGQDDEGIASLERALEIAPGLAESLCNLGRALMRRGEFVRALEALKEGHETGSKDRRWKHPSARWLSRAERLVALEARGAEVASGEPATAEERLRIADEVCRPKRAFAAASALYESAFEIDPTLRETDALLKAAETAFQAGLALGADAPQDEPSRAGLRARARSALEAVVIDCEALRRGGNGDAARERIKPWLASPLIAPSRSPDTDSRISSTESAAWRTLWERAAALADGG